MGGLEHAGRAMSGRVHGPMTGGPMTGRGERLGRAATGTCVWLTGLGSYFSLGGFYHDFAIPLAAAIFSQLKSDVSWRSHDLTHWMSSEKGRGNYIA